MPELIRPYGDTLNDGIMQLAFTLPVEHSAKAKKAATVYLEELGFSQINIASSKKIADNFTYFIAFATSKHSIDYDSIHATEVKTTVMSFYEINHEIKTKLQRPMIVIGATIGSDAHTVGIDAIINMKGYNQDYGLERYPEITAINMGSQVACDELYERAVHENADILLVSQTVTQKDCHIHNFTELIELLEAENMRHKFIVIAGGPRISNDLAIELGYDAGFGAGTVPSQVASFAIERLLKKQ